jgi:hypothetical protein
VLHCCQTVYATVQHIILESSVGEHLEGRRGSRFVQNFSTLHGITFQKTVFFILGVVEGYIFPTVLSIVLEWFIN